MGWRGGAETCGQGHAAEESVEGEENGEVKGFVSSLPRGCGLRFAGLTLTGFVLELVFEGAAHPYKRNLLKFNGVKDVTHSKIPDLAEVKAAFQKAKETAVQA